MSQYQCKTPVALLVFELTKETARVFEVMRQVKPPKLLVVGDGPRAERPDEAKKCAATRAIIDGVDGAINLPSLLQKEFAIKFNPPTLKNLVA